MRVRPFPLSARKIAFRNFLFGAWMKITPAAGVVETDIDTF